MYQEDWRGFRTWNTWETSFYPPIRRQIDYHNAGGMQNVVYARNPAPAKTPAPIPIGQYVLYANQVNTGSQGGGDFRNGIRRR